MGLGSTDSLCDAVHLIGDQYCSVVCDPRRHDVGDNLPICLC